MRVLYVSHSMRNPSKGAPWADLCLLGALRCRGHEVDEVWDFARRRLVRHGNLHFLLEAPHRCRRTVLARLAARSYDVLLVNQPLGWLAGAAAKRRFPGVLYVARSHGWEPRVFQEFATFDPGADLTRDRLRRAGSALLRPFLFRQNEKVMACADGVVVCSEDDRSWMLQRHGITGDRILTMSPGIAEEFRASAAPDMTPSRLRRLLYVGQYAPVKAPEIAAEAITRALGRDPGMEATWVCDAEHHPTIRSLFPSGLSPRVRMLGWMNRADLASIYDESGIYVFPSYYEGFAQTFLEAMSRGMVVLASRIDGMREAIRDGENGFLFERGDAVGIAERAAWLKQNPEAAERVSRSARKTAEGFSWAASAERFDRFVSELGASRR